MGERIRSDELVPSADVGSVHPETTFERIARVLPTAAKGLTAVIGTGAGAVVCIIVIFSSNADLKDLRTGAWTLFAAIVGGCAGYLFGANRELT